MGIHFQAHLNYLLELDSQPADRPNTVAVDAAVEQAITAFGTPIDRVKNFSVPMVSPVEFTLGSGISRSFRRWIEDSLSRNFSRRSGKVIVYGIPKGTVYSFEFYNALFTSIRMPELDRNRKGGDFVVVSVQPEWIKRIPGEGAIDLRTIAKYGSPPKPFDTAHFKLHISGLEKESAHVTRVSSLAIKQGIKPLVMGTERSPHIEPTKLEDSNLIITLPKSAASGLFDWHQRMVKSGLTETKTGSLEYFAAGSTKSTLTLELNGIGILSAQLAASVGQTSHQNMNCTLYFESIKLKSI